MSQITIKCVQCGFELTYNLIGSTEIVLDDFVVMGKVYLCKYCYKKGLK